MADFQESGGEGKGEGEVQGTCGGGGRGAFRVL